MAVGTDLDSVECSQCGTEMELRGDGTEKTLPLIGSEVEYRQYTCPGCGQSTRFERESPDDEWKPAGV